ncbi:MAG: VWA domain-containing protein [Phycisphaerae bacterium]|nr:VWA domain-containing protein [Phycisphaerae bacterium]
MTLLEYPGHLVAAILLGGSAVLMALAFRSYQIGTVGRWRWPLAILQYAAVVVLLVILWNPSRAVNVDATAQNNVLVLFDTSESMSVSDCDGAARLDAALARFAETFAPGDPDSPEYRVYGFSDTCYHCGSASGLRRWGGRSDLHRPLSVLSRQAASAQAVDPNQPTGRTVGAVIFTDGQADDRNPEVYLPLPEHEMEVLWVGVGRSDPRPDLAVTSFRVPPRVMIDTAFDVEVKVSARNLAGREFELELYQDDRLVAARTLGADAMARADVEIFTVGADKLGPHSLRARVVGPQDEVNTANNVRHAMLDVCDTEKCKVLLYSQVANFDIGKIRQALERDKKVQLSFGLDAVIPPTLSRTQKALSGHIKLPADKAGFYEYDVIVLGPCSFATFTEQQIEGLYSFVVDRGGGLVFLPGRGEFDVSICGDPKIRTLLPVLFEGAKPPPEGGEAGFQLTVEGVDSRVLRLESLKDLPYHLRPYHGNLKKKPAAQTLATSSGYPVLCSHRVGRGRAAFVNSYGLFRWYREDLQGGLLQEFLAGLSEFVGRVGSAQSRIELFAERATDQPQDVVFEADVMDDDYRPVENANVLLTVGERTMQMDQADRGRYTLRVRDLEADSLLTRAEVEAGGVFIGETMLATHLPLPKTEMDRVELDREFLQAMAERTGGRYADLDALTPDVATRFEARTQIKRFSHMSSVWTNWWLLGGLCGLLVVNWFLRRALGLI